MSKRKPGNWRPPTPEARERLEPVLKAADVVRSAGKGKPATDPEFQRAARKLLEAAVEWRRSAREATIRNGEPAKPRPAFLEKPKLADPAQPPKHSTYRDGIINWASRYAWDQADALPLAESIQGLLHTAVVGYAMEIRNEQHKLKETN